MKPQNSDFNSYIFTFYIISQISIIIKHQTGLVFRIFRIQSYLMEVLEQPRGRIPVFNVMVICDHRHANISKKRTLLVDSDVAPPQGAV